MAGGNTAAQFVGHVERDPEGRLWAVLFHGGRVVSREPVRSLRRGRRRVTDLVLAAADASVARDLSRRDGVLRSIDTDSGQPPDPSTPTRHRPPRIAAATTCPDPIIVNVAPDDSAVSAAPDPGPPRAAVGGLSQPIRDGGNRRGDQQ